MDYSLASLMLLLLMPGIAGIAFIAVVLILREAFSTVMVWLWERL